MPIIIAFIVVTISIAAILYKTYVGYGDYQWYHKLSFLFFTVFSLFAPLIAFALRKYDLTGIAIYIPRILYFIFGYIMFLFMLSFLRDIIWSIVDLIRHVPLEEMKNPAPLKKANIITAIITLFICLYGYYEVTKIPTVVTYEIASPKIKQPTKIVMLSDLHIDQDTSAKQIKNLVSRVNALNPDAIALVGDIIDNVPAKLYKQTEALKELKAKDGVYVVLGNHEFYVGPLMWGIRFSNMGFEWLGNHGVKLNEDSGIFIAGLNDIASSKAHNMPIKVDNALRQANKDDYVIILSHTPEIAEGITKDNADLQLSAHTHGGQIFPFHYFAKEANDGRLAGFYDVNGIKMYISRGTRYWGIPMRILAPAEITVFNLVPKK